MSLLNKANIITTPTAYSVGKLHSVKPENEIYADFDFARNSSATRVGENGLIQSVAANLPRINYENGVGHLLLEPQRTNRFLYSEDLTQFDLSSSGTGASNPVVTSNYGISPDGTQNADRVQLYAGTDASGNSRITETFTIFGTEETISVYLKSNDGQEYIIDIIQSNQSQDTVTVTSEWQRFSFTNVNTSPDKYGIGLTGLSGETADILAWGLQLEQGSYPTSYIVSNSGSATTRLAEVCDGSGNASTFNDSEGVLMAQIGALANDSTNRIISISDGSGSNRVLVKFDNSSNLIQGTCTVGTDQASLLYYTNDITINSKVLFLYKSNDFQLWVDGFKRDFDTNGTTPSGLDRLNFDNSSGGSQFYGKTKQLQYFDSALTDSELECLTSWSSFNRMAIDLNYTIQ